jgi:hypothetical protein
LFKISEPMAVLLRNSILKRFFIKVHFKLWELESQCITLWYKVHSLRQKIFYEGQRQIENIELSHPLLMRQTKSNFLDFKKSFKLSSFVQ